MAVTNLGVGGSALDAQSGSTSGADTNDVLHLPHDGTNYVYLPGVAGNSVSCTAPAAAVSYAAYPLGGGAATTGAATGGAAFTFSTTGSWLRVDLLNASSAVVASFTAPATGSATAQTDAYAVSWTINRSTSGRKAVAVTSPVWLLGTDDYLECPSADGINFAAGESFTVMCVHRAWATLGTNDALVAKKANTTATTQGWALTAGSSTAAQGQLQVGDGTNGATAVSGSRTSGALSTLIAVRDAAADTLTVYLNGVAGTPVTDATTGSSSNAEVLRIGRLSGAGTEYADMCFHAAAVWRFPLNSDQVATVHDYYAARIGA